MDHNIKQNSLKHKLFKLIILVIVVIFFFLIYRFIRIEVTSESNDFNFNMHSLKYNFIERFVYNNYNIGQLF